MHTATDLIIEHNAPIPTWFKVGGRADALARPTTVEQVRDLLLMFAHQPVRVLGDGANLLVDDEGVDGLVLDLRSMNRVDWPDDSAEPIVRAQAGANLPKLITEAVRRGLAGIETLAGIPATLGGAIVMNAGGAFGQISDSVHHVHALTRTGELLSIPIPEIHFSYRHSGLNHLIIVAADLRLRRVAHAEQPALRDRLKEVMAYKKNSQPMADNSAGCYWKNPTDPADPTKRLSAGKLIDDCGLKGVTFGGATVSPVHANFVVTAEGCKARDIVALMESVRRRVTERTGITLEPEVVYWRRG
ncbi:MAG: UDP-N-acetylmuramate dehydrogenase [Phycisphaerae bacterium]|nr:UDP-N-acetylmuramate dehydrogenase [Phycisphaerae bacterium]